MQSEGILSFNLNSNFLNMRTSLKTKLSKLTLCSTKFSYDVTTEFDQKYTGQVQNSC